jgi:hypothetical protein
MAVAAVALCVFVLRVALLTCTLLRIDIGTIGRRWRPWRWQILAYATPLLFCLIGYVAVWAAGLGGFPNGKTVDSLKAALGIPSLSTSQVILLWTFLSLIAGTVRSMASARGEQIGWSEFLSLTSPCGTLRVYARGLHHRSRLGNLAFSYTFLRGFRLRVACLVYAAVLCD